ncbi:MAG: DUF1570 domain-containing protein [Selenomonas sp.]|uniref:DUF1570 domain-containing protein n=1 Tax=Selenomonas sp. TaxID=2053611 RepID=UPI0025E8EAE9|nr:DUF1570 domain-containing protein [Selenomonas sp.]MCR5757933.1 DUF1570 domain-containing protein [Selenomonas sp.]
MKKIIVFLLFVVAAAGFFVGMEWGPAGIAPGETAITVDSLGQPDAAVLKDVKVVAAAFPQFVADRFQLPMQRHTEIWVAADTAGYEELLKDKLGMEEQDSPQKAQYTNGQSSGRKALVAIDGSKKKLGDSSERFSTTAHELFHQLQYELSDGQSGYENSLFWLEEGTADYVGALVCEQLGGRSVEKWYMDALFTLQNAREVADVSQLQHTTDEERMQLMTAQAKHYTLADVMTMYLLQHYGGDSPEQKIVAYYKSLENAQAEQAFVQAFGVELPAFLQEFSHWWQGQLQAPAQIDVVVRSGIDEGAAQQFKQQVQLSRQWLQTKWGRDLRGRYKLVLVSSPADFAKAMQEYCHVSAVEAKSTANGSVWAENNSTVFVNLERVTEKRQAVFVSGSMVSRLLMMQQLGNDDGGMSWLLRGGSYMSGVGRLVEMGQGTLPAYQRAWRKELRQNAPLPTLDKILTAEELQAAMDQYGSEEVSLLCEYAAAELINRYGWKALYVWQEVARASGDGKQAFAQVFGIPLTDFAVQVHMMVY